jgi:hypothetical protein
MSLYTVIKVWSAGEILTAADLNTEFANDILNGPINHASQHASGGVDDIKAYFLSLSAGGTVAAAVTFSAAAPITLTSRLNEYKGSDIVAASTTDIGAATGNFVDVTGNTTITALGTVQAGTRRIVRFTGTPTLTHNGTSLILPGAANIVVAANDIATFLSLGTGNWVCESYQRAVNPPYVQSPTPAANTVPVSEGDNRLNPGWVDAITDGTNNIHIKIIDMGDWAMPTTASILVVHGLTATKIRSVQAVIRNDTDTTRYPVTPGPISTAAEVNAYIYDISATDIQLLRKTAGVFDTTAFDSTSYNRGWVTITYVE